MTERKFYTQEYADVSVTTHTTYGLMFSKTFRIKKNEEKVRDRIRIMCINHDLRYIDTSETYQEPSCMCFLKYFNSLLDADIYIKQKAASKNYSIIVRGNFIKAKIGGKEYVYRFKSTNIRTNEK